MHCEYNNYFSCSLLFIYLHKVNIAERQFSGVYGTKSIYECLKLNTTLSTLYTSYTHLRSYNSKNPSEITLKVTFIFITFITFKTCVFIYTNYNVSTLVEL